ncbi:MAG: hypothetical protein ACP5E4_01265, partial [Candidatus Aenigmatarchaeota archaeon]
MPTTAQLELTVAFSEELGEVIGSRLVARIKKCAGGLFQRGTYSSNRLFLSFEGKDEMSPFINALIKKLSETAREYKLGVRDFYLPYYELVFDCDHVGKLEVPFTETAICNGKTCKVVFRDLEKDMLKGGIARIMSLIQSKTREKTWKLVHKSGEETGPQINPFKEVERQKYVKKGLARNEYFYLPKGMKELRAMKKSLMDSLLQNFPLEEFFPISYTTFGLLEKKDILNIVPPEIMSRILAEPDNPAQAYESYFLTGKVPPIKGAPKGIVFEEIPFYLYEALGKRIVQNPHYIYTQKGTSLLITFFEPESGYEASKKKMLETLRGFIEGLGLTYRIVSRKINGEMMRIDCYLPHNKTWLTSADMFFSEDCYTKPFGIIGKSGQVNVSLENFFLSMVAQGKHSPAPEGAGEIPAVPEELFEPEFGHIEAPFRPAMPKNPDSIPIIHRVGNVGALPDAGEESKDNEGVCKTGPKLGGRPE